MSEITENQVDQVDQVVETIEVTETKVVEDEDDDEDDNELVTAEDLEDKDEEPEVTNKWDDPELLEQLQKEMELLKQVRFKEPEITEEIMTKAMAEVIGPLGLGNYNDFRNTVSQILRNPRGTIPFSLKVKDQMTGRYDFWLIKSFVKIDNNIYYESESGDKILKKTVLMSREFNNFLKSYCKEKLKDELQFWIFTGSGKGRQNLDISKLNDSEKERLPEQDANKLVMIQFKKKTPEIMIGAKK